MTEHEWLTSDDPAAMLAWICPTENDYAQRLIGDVVIPRPSARKLRLFGLNLYVEYLKVRNERWGLEKLEYDWIDNPTLDLGRRFEWNLQFQPPAVFANCSLELYSLYNADPKYQYIRASVATAVALLRDLVGNPWKPLMLPPAVLTWQHGTIPRIAQDIYDHHAWSEVGVMHDALIEAEAPPEVVEHFMTDDVCKRCRGEGEITSSHRADCNTCNGTGRIPRQHWRGCHVVDLILGKE